MWMEINFVFFKFLSKNSVTDSGRSIFGQFSLRIKLVTVIGTKSNVSVGSLRDLSEFHVYMILVKG